MKSQLIIVESPSKIKTLKKFLDDKYIVEASVGHIRDLPKSNLGIEVDNNFSAEYHVSPDSAKTVKALKQALKNANELLIATDPDREGEAIAWHIVDELKPKIADLVSKQRKLLTGVLAESKKIMADGDTKEGGFLLWIKNYQ